MCLQFKRLTTIHSYVTGIQCKWKLMSIDYMQTGTEKHAPKRHEHTSQDMLDTFGFNKH